MIWKYENGYYYLYCHKYNESEESICYLSQDKSDEYHFEYYLECDMTDSEEFWECGIQEAKRFCELKFKEYLEDEIRKYQDMINDIENLKENNYE